MKSRCVLLSILFMAMLIRGGVMLQGIQRLSDDPDAYRLIATTLAQTGVFGLPDHSVAKAKPTAFRPPLYPWLLSKIVSNPLGDKEGRLTNGAVAMLHWLLGSITVLIVFDIARRLLGMKAGVLAAFLTAIDPILMWQSTLVMTETLATFLSMLVWWWWVLRWKTSDAPQCQTGGLTTAVVLGVLLGLAFLGRPTFLVWTVLIVPALMLVGPTCRIRRVTVTAVTALIFVAILAGWTMRNLTVMGHPIWATSHGGYTLLLANNDSFYDYLETKPMSLPWASQAWDAEPFFEQYRMLEKTGNEVADDAVAYQVARETIRRRPATFVYSCWIRFVRLWQPFPHATSGRSTVSIAAVGGFYVLLATMVAMALIRHYRALSTRHWRRMMIAWPAITLIVTLSVVHAVYWSNPRMRAPANPILAIAAAAVIIPKRFKHEHVVPDADRPE